MAVSRKVKGFEDLEVWRAADRLAHGVFRLARSFPRVYSHDLTTQLRRASLSIPSNIAEGSASLHSKELIQSLNVARRSLAETRCLLLFARDEGLIPAGNYEKLADACLSVGRMLTSLIRSISSRRNAKDHG
ncbi:MAG: four helix bundle protein [Candidatus Methylomirabilales bacterium]